MHPDCQVDLGGLDLAIDLQKQLGAFDKPMKARDIVDLRHIPTGALPS